ncbi:MAG: hypothetical protein ABIS59_02485 [Candidatus Saccharibacteria bacterium]
MRTKIQKNEEGFALVLELIVVALVLSAVGVGVYNYHSHTSGVASEKTQNVAVKAAADINDSLTKSADIETKESTGADALGDQLEATDAATADVEGGVDENSF